MLHSKLLKALAKASTTVTLSRKKRGPLCPEWTWFFEMATEVLRHVTSEAFTIKDIPKQRELYDSYHLPSHSLLKVWIEPSDFKSINGRWFSPKVGHTHQRVILYLHGGGYVLYSKYHDNLMSWISHYTESRLFALDYPLAPESPFPAALDYAYSCYQAFLDRYADANNIILMGDSAGGGLVVSLLQRLRERGLEMPEKAILLSPWLDLTETGEATLEQNAYDWIDGRMGQEWARLYSNGQDLSNPLISPLYADLKNFPELYVQYGSKEALASQIEKFIAKALAEGASIRSDNFKGMNHVFQYFGDLVPQSKEALLKIKEFMESPSTKAMDKS